MLNFVCSVFLAHLGGLVLLFGFERSRMRWGQYARPPLTLSFCCLLRFLSFLLSVCFVSVFLLEVLWSSEVS